MDIQHQGTATGGRFVTAEAPGAELVYLSLKPRALVVDHTFVPEKRRGEGIGATLLGALADYARTMGLKIDPRCPFARRKFEQHREWQDLLEH